MLYSLVKWYALTIGAYKYWRWWKSLSPTQQLNIYLKRVYVTRLREALNEPNLFLRALKVESVGVEHEMRVGIHRQIYGTENPV